MRAEGEPVGHVTTGEYGSQMLSLGGVNHLTHGGKSEGRVTCETLLDLCNGKPVELTIDGGATVIVEAGKPPIVNGAPEQRMRVGCGSATIGMFARQWFGKVDEVVVVDDHITGVLSEHQAGKLLGARDTGIRMKGRRSTPGRYFHVAEPGTGWGGAAITDPLDIVAGFNPKVAWPGLTMLMVSTTGEQHAFYRLDEAAAAGRGGACPEALRESVARITENCEPALCTVLFMAGAGGSLRAGVTENPVRLTRSVREALTTVTAGGAPVYVWPGGGITFMVDVSLLPKNAFGYVPTPGAGRADRVHAAAGGLRRARRPCRRGPAACAKCSRATRERADQRVRRRRDARRLMRAQFAILPDGRRHFHDGPIDLILQALGADDVAAAYAAAAARFATILDELCAELPRLRAASRSARREGAVARRMARAVAPFAASALRHADGRRRRRRRGGSPRRDDAGRRARPRLCQQRRRHRAASRPRRVVHPRHGRSPRPPVPARQGRASAAQTASRGVATSGWRGRSFSLGIADAVTVLARTAAAGRRGGDADRQRRRPARPSRDHRALPPASRDPQSDLGERLVTLDVGPLTRRRDRRRARRRRARGASIGARAA